MFFAITYMNLLMNCCFRQAMQVIQYLVVCIIVLINCWILKSYKLSDVALWELLGGGMVSAAAFSIWLLLLQITIVAHIKTKKLIRIWKSHIWSNRLDQKYMRLFTKSLTPYTIYLGSFYKILPIRIIIFLNTIIWSTLRVLLTF